MKGPGESAQQHTPADSGARNETSRQLLAGYLQDLLEPDRIEDYCPNGLQVEGTTAVRRIASAVTASLAVVRVCVRDGFDTLLVHHGYFWRGEDPRVIGPRRARLAELLRADINLFAYHLPLDLHPEVGNNACLGRALGWPAASRLGKPPLLSVADLPVTRHASDIAALLAERLGQPPLQVGDAGRPIRRIAWCTGAAQDMLQDAIDAGADAFVSGEINERTTHLAREAQVVYFAAGHHATERLGVQAVVARAAAHFGLEHGFIDDPNPV